MRFHSLDEWLLWLESYHPTAIDLGLQRVGDVAGRMGLLKPALQVVTVAGTNGKGSVVAVLESILLAAGLRVGSYTSPHLVRYNERVKINGTPVSDGSLCAAMDRVDTALDGQTLTYFEFGTLAALSLFEDNELDVALLEVGLGGRLDAVNIVDPDIAVITQIDIDHVEWLGSDRESIALEKAGILRKGIPVICAEDEPPLALQKRIGELDCACYLHGRDFGFQSKPNPTGDRSLWYGVDWDDIEQRIEVQLKNTMPRSTLPAPSIAAAAEAALLLHVGISEQSIRQGISNTYLPGRLQQLRYAGMDIVMDVAHNVAGAQYLATYLRNNQVKGRTIAIFAVMSDKEFVGIVKAIEPELDVWLLPGLSNERAVSPQLLLDKIEQKSGMESQTCVNIEQAFERAGPIYQQGDRVVVFGSFYTVAAALALQEKTIVQ